MKIRILFVLMVFCFQTGNSQKAVQVDSRELKADRFIGMDTYQNLYFVKNNILHKQGLAGNFSFTEFQLGTIYSVDIINPLKIVVFYQNTNTAIFLDNKLNEIQRINFSFLARFLTAGSVSAAGSNSLWVFNSDSRQLERYNEKSNSYSVVSQPFPGEFISQASNINYCFILTDKKLRAFNIYGSLVNEADAPGFEKIVQDRENVLALRDQALFYFPDFARRKSRETINFEIAGISGIAIRDLQLIDEILYIYDGKNLMTFKLTLPKK